MHTLVLFLVVIALGQDSVTGNTISPSCTVDYSRESGSRMSFHLNMASPKGDQGPPGEQGPVGLTGLTGSKGDQGPVGLRGDKGDKGSQGIVGNPGQTGAPGLPGTVPAEELEQLKLSQFVMKNYLNISIITKIYGRVYVFGKVKSSWEDARRACIRLGGDLFAKGIRNEAIFNATLKEVYKHTDQQWYWVGVVHNTQANNYRFVDGPISSTSDFYWAKGEPNQSGHCIAFPYKGGIDDIHCNSFRKPLCEIEMA